MPAEHIIKSYDEELARLNKMVVEMGGLATRSKPSSSATARWPPGSSRATRRSTSSSATSTIWRSGCSLCASRWRAICARSSSR
jgi:hypothetical protein